MGGEAFYLINATDGNLQRSGMAFYANEDDVSVHREPTVYIDIESAGYTIWEGSLHSGQYSC
jgi:hypothetical protein